MTYDDIHRFFLRSIASRGVLTVPEAYEVLQTFSEDVDVLLDDLVSEINPEIRPYQQKIKLTTDEVTGEEVVIFLSLGFDETAKVQNFFAATDLDYFRILIEEIMSTETRRISGIYALNLISKMKSSLSKIDAEKLLHLWCQMKYLDKAGESFALGVRAIHEFESYFRQNMPDSIEECYLCKQIVFRGCNCPACAKALHTRCLNKYTEKMDKWPCCKVSYSQNQLDRMYDNDNSRLVLTESNDVSHSPVYDDEEVMPTQDTVTDLTQNTVIGVSQSVTRKRKRQRIAE